MGDLGGLISPHFTQVGHPPMNKLVEQNHLGPTSVRQPLALRARHPGRGPTSQREAPEAEKLLKHVESRRSMLKPDPNGSQHIDSA